MSSADTLAVEVDRIFFGQDLRSGRIRLKSQDDLNESFRKTEAGSVSDLSVQFGYNRFGEQIAELSVKGATAKVALQGASLISCSHVGELFFLSDSSQRAEEGKLDSRFPVSGGLSPSLPIFKDNRAIPIEDHPVPSPDQDLSFGERNRWSVLETDISEEDRTALIRLGLSKGNVQSCLNENWISSEFGFEVTYKLSANSLLAEMVIINDGKESFSVSPGFQNWLNVADLNFFRFEGLSGIDYQDHIVGGSPGTPAERVENPRTHTEKPSPVTYSSISAGLNGAGRFERTYLGLSNGGEFFAIDGLAKRAISLGFLGFDAVQLSNPGPYLSGSSANLNGSDYRNFIKVSPLAFSPVEIKPGENKKFTQSIRPVPIDDQPFMRKVA